MYMTSGGGFDQSDFERALAPQAGKKKPREEMEFVVDCLNKFGRATLSDGRHLELKLEVTDAKEGESTCYVDTSRQAQDSVAPQRVHIKPVVRIT